MLLEDFNNLIGSNIKKIRLSKNLTQESLSEKSNTNSKYIGDVERGEKTISVYKLYKILNAMNISLFEFFKQINI